MAMRGIFYKGHTFFFFKNLKKFFNILFFNHLSSIENFFCKNNFD